MEPLDPHPQSCVELPVQVNMAANVHTSSSKICSIGLGLTLVNKMWNYHLHKYS